MVAAEEITEETSHFATSAKGEDNPYITLFHRYISRSIESLLARIDPDQQLLSPPEREEVRDEVREEAWHLLDYGLKLQDESARTAWEGVRKLLYALAPRMERDGFRHEWLPFLEGGIAYSRRMGDLESEAQLSLYSGRLYRLRGDLNQARAAFLHSAQLYQEVGNEKVGSEKTDKAKIAKAGRAKALNQLAYVARLQNQFPLTQAYVDEALSLLDELDALGEDETERANCHWVLGAMAYAQLDWEAAEVHNRASLEIWQRAGNQQRAAWSLQNLGDALRAAGKYEEAAAHLQEAIVILGQLHDPVNQAIARMNRGVVHIYAYNSSNPTGSPFVSAMGAEQKEKGVGFEGNNDPSQALALFQLAEPIFRQVGDQLHLAMLYTNMMIVQRDLAHYASAEESGKRALHLATILNDLKLRANAHDELSLIYLAQKRRADAIATLQAGLAVIAQVPPDSFQKMVQGSLQEHLAQAQALPDEA